MRKHILLAAISFFSLVICGEGKNRDFAVLKHREKTFENSGCKKNSSCDLKSVTYTAEDYKVGVGDGFNYGTRFSAEYETASLPALKKYVFVQFILGCRFSSKKNADDTITISYGWSVDDRKSTRLNSSHQIISYAVFCLKKKKNPKGKFMQGRTHLACLSHNLI